MKNNMKKILTLINLIVILTMGCSFLNFGTKGISNPDTSGAQAEENQPGVPAAGVDGEVEAVLAEGNYEPPQVNLPDLGKVDFSINSSKTSQVEYPADGTDVTLELTDDSGLTWKLVVPGIALEQPQTLKMTALSGLQSDDIPGELQGGILLEPDGLLFLVPATLTVTGEGLGDKIMLLTGAQNGSAMDLTLPGEETNSALIYHFSSAVANNWQGGSLDDFRNWLNKQNADVEAEARQFLKDHKNDLKVPEPPSIPLECPGKDSPSAAQFVKDASEPEATLIIKLLSIKKGQALVGNPYDETFSLELSLVSRLLKKASLLLKTYNKQEDKFTAVAAFALNSLREAQLLGGGNDSPLLANIGQMCADMVDQLIKDIKEKHEYRKIGAVWTMAKNAALMGNTSQSVEDLLSKLQSALVFQFKGKFHFYTGDSDWVMDSEFPVRLDEAMFDVWKGSGSGTTVYIDKKPGEHGVYTMVPSPFTVNAQINSFDACEGTANISVDRFTGDSETLTYTDHTWSGPITKTFWEGLFKNYTSHLGYTFTVKLHDKDVNAVDETIVTDHCGGGGCYGDFNIKLEHKPGK
jgi:hypothetical protein